MKNRSFIFIILLFCSELYAQVSVSNDGSAPVGSAMLDVKSSTQGMLIPRISTAARDLIPSPATGLLIYNTTTNRFNYYNGSYWYQMETIFISSTTGTLSPGGGVSINALLNAVPDNSAMMDINNPTRGILLPGTTPELITSPATGLIIYNTATNLLSYYNGTQWSSLCAISTGIEGVAGSQSSIGMAIKDDNSGPHNSAILDVSSAGKGILIPRLTNAQRNLILPVAGLVIYNTSANAIEFFNGTEWYQLVTNLFTSPTVGTHIPSADQIIWNWNALAGATGYKWNIVNDYASATDMVTATTKTETGLACGTDYTRYVWAYNACGNSTPLTLTQATYFCSTCGSAITANHLASGGIAPVDKTVTYGIVTYIPGEMSKCWITSNLGATHQAASVDDASEASAGWYWQFNRKQGYMYDGTRTPNTPWETPIVENLNWEYANDPCAHELGGGWRLPTSTEWYHIVATGGWGDWTGPWNSALKLHAAGYFDPNGVMSRRGQNSGYFSSTQNGPNYGWDLYFNSGSCQMYDDRKAYGMTLRCLRE